MTDHRMNELKQAFDLFDADKSGEINSSELRNVLAKLNLKVNDAELEQLLNVMDKNGNGKIEFNEFAKEMGSQYYRKHTRADVEDAFRQFDQDNNGYVTIDELYEIMKRFRGSVTREQIKHMVDKIDKDNNGKINIDEFMKLIE